MSPNLERISVKARAHPDLVFTSLYHHIADIDHLRTCYRLLKANKAVGVDEVTKSMYAEDLEANLQDLSAHLKRMGYRPQPRLRVYIPKPGSEKGRPLGMRIPSVHYLSSPAIFGIRDDHPSPSPPLWPAL